MLTIDGSEGEGGGQILRSALGLSMLTGMPFRISRIRANREKPGLMRQHLTAVLAAAQVCSAEVTGAAVGSSELTFKPKMVQPGQYTFSVGTAGSTTLVFQAILPALLTTDGQSLITFEGGTHNMFAPPFDFLEKSFLSIVNRMGPVVNVRLDRPGFYPSGGGVWSASITPTPNLSPLQLLSRGELTRRRCTALIASLPAHVAVRELAVCRKAFDWPESSFQVRQIDEIHHPGNVLMIEIGSQEVCEVFTSFGQRGVTAETVAERCVKEAQAYLASDAPVGEHLADQLLIPMAMAGKGAFVTTELSRHTRTNMDIVQRFLSVKIRAEAIEDGKWRVEVGA